MNATIATKRMTLTAAKTSDVPELFSFLGDPDAMSMTYCHTSLAECGRRIAIHEAQRQHDGCAPWVIRLTDDRSVVGYGGLFEDPFEPGWGVELGYYFHPRVWGLGLATELATAALHHADETLGLGRVAAFAHPQNSRSRRLLASAGFQEQCFIPKLQRYHFIRKRFVGSPRVVAQDATVFEHDKILQP